jgi:TP901 family phage tail tape measure protein
MADRKEYELLFKLNAQLGGSYNSTFKQGTAVLGGMQKELQNLNKLQGDISSYQRQQGAVDTTKGKLQTLQTQYKNIEAEYQKTGANSVDLKNKMLDKQLQIERTNTALQQQSDKLTALGVHLKEAGVDTASLKAESVRLADEYQTLASRQERVADSLQDGATQGQSFGEETTLSIGNIAGALKTAGIAVLLKKVYDQMVACSQEAATLETAIAKIETVAGSGADMDKMTSDMIALSKETGKVATELSGATYEAISSGIATANAAGFTEKAAKLAVGGFTDTTAAVDVLTTIINSYGKSADEAAHISDVLITTQNLGKTTVDKLASSMGMVIPTAAAYGTGLEDISTAYALMTSSGMSTERTTTYINSMLNELGDTSSEASEVLMSKTGKSFSELMKSGASLGDVLALINTGMIDTSGKAALDYVDSLAKLEKQGLKTDTAQEKYRDTLEKIVEAVPALRDQIDIENNSVKGGLGGLRDTITSWVAETSGTGDITMFSNLWGSQEAQKAALSLLNIGAEKYNTTMGQMKNSAGATEAAFAIMNDTTEASQNRYDAAATAFQIAIGEKINPTLQDMQEAGTVLLENITELIEGHESLTEQMEAADDEYDNNMGQIAATGTVALGYIDRLKDLEDQGLKTKEAHEEYHGILEKLVTIMPSLKDQIDLENDSIKGGTDALKANTQEWMRNAVAQSYQTLLKQKTDAYVATQSKLDAAESSLNAAIGKYEVLNQQAGAESVAAALGTTVQALTQYTESDWSSAYQAFAEKGNGTAMLDEYAKYRSDISDTAIEIEKQQTAVDSYTKQLADAQNEVESVAASMSNLTTIVDELVAAIGPHVGADAGEDTEASRRFYRAQGVKGYASGLAYVPYDNFPAMLHQGERVLTANEARSYDDGRGGISISLEYNPVVNAGNASDLDEKLKAHGQAVVKMVVSAIDAREIDRGRRRY